ncbi:MAG: hypothetical protein DYG91_10195 [Chloroflexi bacterium CFX7]|nr:hypothetical protein [Chloroflexi bacterium CFX7]MCK6563263.1 hypothetical protein [Dehalococcoidia bacterium]RIL02433.1 MAG: hypothetical protein DCC78_07115 [bacterium]
MAAMTKKERVRAALAGAPVDRPPVSMWGHDYLREWSPRELADVTLEQYHAFGWDFIKLNPRASYFAEAWGNGYQRPAEPRHPELLSVAVQEASGLDSIRPVDPRGGVFAEHLEALRLVLNGVAGEADVIHTIFSPLSVTAQLCGLRKEFAGLAAQNPAGAHAALAAVTVTLAAYARAALEAGAAGIFFAPLAWASQDISSPDFYREFGRPYDLQVLAGVREAPFNVLHVCRNNNMIGLLLDYPVAAFNWADHGPGNPSLAAVKAQTTKAVMGGVDQAALATMNASEVAAQVREAVATAGPDRLLVTAGCSIPPETPAANRAALAQAAG